MTIDVGYTKDKEIADKVVGIDIVVGGHTNTFLYTGTPPSNESPLGPYPTVINPSYDSNRRVLVVQDFYFGKYLGDLQGNVVIYFYSAINNLIILHSFPF